MPEQIAMREAFGQTLVSLGQRLPDLVVLDADVSPSTRAVLFAQAFPQRFFQVGIAEQNMIGMAAGLSTLGFIPFTSTFACFVKRDLDQILPLGGERRRTVALYCADQHLADALDVARVGSLGRGVVPRSASHSARPR